MAHYRLYFLASENGRIHAVETLEAGSDAEALAWANGYVGDKPMELWSGARKLQQFGAIGFYGR